MPNITLAISEDLHARMRQHSEIRWSEVVRKTITQKIEDLDVMDKLTAKSKLRQRNVDEIASKVDRAVARKLSLRR